MRSVAPSAPPTTMFGMEASTLKPVIAIFGNARGSICCASDAGNPNVEISKLSLNGVRTFGSRVNENRNTPSRVGENEGVSSMAVLKRRNTCGPVPGDAGLSRPYGAARVNGESSDEYRRNMRFFTLK